MHHCNTYSYINMHKRHHHSVSLFFKTSSCFHHSYIYRSWTSLITSWKYDHTTWMQSYKSVNLSRRVASASESWSATAILRTRKHRMIPVSDDVDSLSFQEESGRSMLRNFVRSREKIQNWKPSKFRKQKPGERFTLWESQQAYLANQGQQVEVLNYINARIINTQQKNDYPTTRNEMRNSCRLTPADNWNHCRRIRVWSE